MDHLTIELDDDLCRQLNELAETERTSPQELAKEAIKSFVADRKPPTSPDHREGEPHAALRAMIGLASRGRPDSSINHDY